MKVLVIDNGTKHLGKLKNLLFKFDVTVLPLFSKYTNTDNYDLIILSGGSQFSITSAPEIFKEEIDLVKTSNVPIIGICQGCEIVAKAFNSKLEFTERKTHGIKRIKVTRPNSIFNGNKEFFVYESHHFAITKLGKSLTHLAKSQTGYEVIKHKTKPIYGLQFHPEMLQNQTLGDEIFKSIIKDIINI